ncbi:hypothetical protein V8G54_009661 [Vigna mungo]|uniref:Uncharacterized protein n=1 Tax=Vigna mungo TaxID=3915 RepID=A0AAQ3NV91_VIGMU
MRKLAMGECGTTRKKIVRVTARERKGEGEEDDVCVSASSRPFRRWMQRKLTSKALNEVTFQTWGADVYKLIDVGPEQRDVYLLAGDYSTAFSGHLDVGRRGADIQSTEQSDFSITGQSTRLRSCTNPWVLLLLGHLTIKNLTKSSRTSQGEFLSLVEKRCLTSAHRRLLGLHRRHMMTDGITVNKMGADVYLGAVNAGHLIPRRLDVRLPKTDVYGLSGRREDKNFCKIDTHFRVRDAYVPVINYVHQTPRHFHVRQQNTDVYIIINIGAPSQLSSTRLRGGNNLTTTRWRWRDRRSSWWLAVVFVVARGGAIGHSCSSLFSFWFYSGCKEEDGKLTERGETRRLRKLGVVDGCTGGVAMGVLVASSGVLQEDFAWLLENADAIDMCPKYNMKLTSYLNHFFKKTSWLRSTRKHSQSIFYEGLLALGQQQFEMAKLHWSFALAKKIDLSGWDSKEPLQLFDNVPTKAVEDEILTWFTTEAYGEDFLPRQDMFRFVDYGEFPSEQGVVESCTTVIGLGSSEESNEINILTIDELHGSLLQKHSRGEAWERQRPCIQLVLTHACLVSPSQISQHSTTLTLLYNNPWNSTLTTTGELLGIRPDTSG